MKRRTEPAGARAIHGLLLLAVIAALFAPRPAAACKCGRARGPGEAFTRAEVVFVGTVGRTKQIDKTNYETTFAVGEVFRGKLGKTAVVASEWNGGSCDHGRYKAGEQMLVYAGGTGTLNVSTCSGTKPLDQADDDLAFLRGIASAKTAMVEGVVRFYDDSQAAGDGEPRANMEVRARGTKHATRTTADGTYRLELPPGTYTIELADPGPGILALGSPSEPVALPVIGAWASHNITLVWNSRIRGRLLDHTGKPAANVLVHALRGDEDDLSSAGSSHGPSARTDASGNYEISRVPRGTYHVAVSVLFYLEVPVTYYPGTSAREQARAIAITRPGAVVEHIDFRLCAPEPLAPSP